MEWTIVGVIVVLIGLIAAITKPLLAWNANIVQNTEAIKTLTATIGRNEKSNAEEHVALWDECEKQGDRLGDHETRISVLEHQR